MPIIESADTGCFIRLKVVPGSSRDAVGGALGDRLKLKVAAAAESGKANIAVCSLLARALGVKARDVEIVSGMTSPEKLIRIVGVSTEQAKAMLKLD